MTDLVKIDDEVITTEDFVKLLRFTGAFDGLLEDIIKDKLTVHAAKKAGIKVTVQKDAADTFWDNTWGVAPFTFSSWGYRSFFTQWLQSFVSYNAQETRWNDSSQKKASRLVYKAAATADPVKRKSLAVAAQQLHWDDGGYIIPYFKQTLDGANKRVQGLVPHVFPALSWYRFWNYWLS